MAAEVLGAERTVDLPSSAAEPVAAGGFDLAVRNLGRGGIVELAVRGSLEGDAVGAFRGRLRTLATKRQPATLRVDLTDATSFSAGAVDAVLDAAAILDGFGSRLVLCNPDAGFEHAVPADRWGRSLQVERAGREA